MAAALVALLVLTVASVLLGRVVWNSTRPTLVAPGGRVPGPFRSTRRGLGPRSASTAALLGIVAVSVAASAYFTSTSGFYGDDFINFREVQLARGLSLRFLASPTSAHFAPGHRLGDWLLASLAPLDFRAAQVALLVGFAASLFVFHRLLSELFDPRPSLVLTFLYGTSTVQVAVHQWWASGLDRVPATFFTFLSILGYLRFHRARSRLWLAISVAAQMVALLFYVKPIFIPLYLILLRVLLLCPDEPVRVSIAAAVRQWRVWLLYLVPVALFSVVYLAGYKAAGQVRSPSPRVLGHYLANLWFRVAAPGAFGLYVPPMADSLVATGALVGVELAIVAGVVWSLVRRRGAWRAWLFLAITLLANAFAVGLTRIGVFGPRRVAYELIYNLEIVYLTVIVVGVVARSSRRDRVRPEASVRSLGAQTRARAVVATGMASYLALSWWGSHRISQADVWPGPTARVYAARVTSFLRTGDGPGASMAFVDGTVPEPVMFPLAGPWTSESEVFPVLDRHVSFEANGRDLFAVADDGTARPVTFRSDAGGDMTALLGLGVVGYDAKKAAVRGGALCVTSRKASEAVTVDVPAGAGGDDPSVRVRLSASRRQVAAFVTEPRGGGPLSAPRYTWLNGDGQSHEIVFTIPAGPLQRLFVIIGPHTELCLSRVEVGRLTDRA